MDGLNDLSLSFTAETYPYNYCIIKFAAHDAYKTCLAKKLVPKAESQWNAIPQISTFFGSTSVSFFYSSTLSLSLSLSLSSIFGCIDDSSSSSFCCTPPVSCRVVPTHSCCLIVLSRTLLGHSRHARRNVA